MVPEALSPRENRSERGSGRSPQQCVDVRSLTPTSSLHVCDHAAVLRDTDIFVSQWLSSMCTTFGTAFVTLLEPHKLFRFVSERSINICQERHRFTQQYNSIQQNFTHPPCDGLIPSPKCLPDIYKGFTAPDSHPNRVQVEESTRERRRTMI